MNILSLILLWLIILLTGSASGLCVGLAIILFWLFIQKDKIWALLGSMGAFGIVSFIWIKYPQFFSSSYRIEMWKIIYENFKNKAITGFGLGSFGTMKYHLASSHYRHTHNDYFQVAFELGLIGLSLLLWCIWEYFRTFRTFRTDLTDRLATIFLGFCLLSLFSFNAHLWQIAVIGMIGYSFLYCLKNEVRLED